MIEGEDYELTRISNCKSMHNFTSYNARHTPFLLIGARRSIVIGIDSYNFLMPARK